MPDLLSTATALHALAILQVPLAPIQDSCLDFIDTLWTNRGGFYGSWADDPSTANTPTTACSPSGISRCTDLAPSSVGVELAFSRYSHPSGFRVTPPLSISSTSPIALDETLRTLTSRLLAERTRRRSLGRPPRQQRALHRDRDRRARAD